MQQYIYIKFRLDFKEACDILRTVPSFATAHKLGISQDGLRSSVFLRTERFEDNGISICGAIEFVCGILYSFSARERYFYPTTVGPDGSAYTVVVTLIYNIEDKKLL